MRLTGRNIGNFTSNFDLKKLNLDGFFDFAA
jgi:hypothetical protein